MNNPPDIAHLLQQAAQQLASTSDSPRLDAELLLAFVLQQSRTWLHTWPEKIPDEQQHTQFQQLLIRRQQGEPVAHLTGERGFWTLDLQVSSDTLIPRPETELLVEQALARIPADADWQILDLGTGSGAIALSLASERPRCSITATDQSSAALHMAQANAARHHIRNVQFVHGNWFAALADQRFHMIVSNPPYVRDNDPHLQQGDVRFEPRSALVAGKDGLDDIRTIVAHAPAYLEKKGTLLIEHGYDQADAVTDLFRQAGFTTVTTRLDHNRQPRVTFGNT